MKTRMVLGLVVVWLVLNGGSVWGYSEGMYNNFFGDFAGASNTTGWYNTFIGTFAGYLDTIGESNTFVGDSAGINNVEGSSNTFLGRFTGFHNLKGNSNTFVGVSAGGNTHEGDSNTFVGRNAGYNNNDGHDNTYIGRGAGYWNFSGFGNVFLGYSAGSDVEGSNRLYIANSNTPTPLIYGEFDNNKLTINGNLEVIGPDNGLVRLSNVSTDNTTKVSRMVLRHYSNAQLPVYLFGAASTATNNFVAFGGGNTIGNAATQIDFFTDPNTTTPVGIPRLTIIDNGNVGVGTQTPSYPLQMAGGAYSNGGSWIDASSREYKDDIERLTSEEAFEALQGLDPVKYAYKTDRTEKRVGFIAEDVPELIATKDRKGLSPMDIVAVLTKVVQEQQGIIKELQGKNERLEQRLQALEAK